MYSLEWWLQVLFAVSTKVHLKLNMKLYTLSVLYKASDGKVKKLSAAYELSSFGYFQKKRYVVDFAKGPVFCFVNSINPTIKIRLGAAVVI